MLYGTQSGFSGGVDHRRSRAIAGHIGGLGKMTARNFQLPPCPPLLPDEFRRAEGILLGLQAIQSRGEANRKVPRFIGF